MNFHFYWFFLLLSIGISSYYEERWRPQFHFSPPQNWCNDPCGLIHFNNTYHLYFQYNPHGLEFPLLGKIDWGHATSKDLVRWEFHGIAMSSTTLYRIFTGSSIAFNGNIYAFYTADYDGLHENQRLAISFDGYSFEDLGERIDIDKFGFRDPKIISLDGRYIVAVSVPYDRKISFFGNSNLTSKKWVKLSEFSDPKYNIKSFGEVWECPNLVPLDDDNEYFLLVIGTNRLLGGTPDQAIYYYGHFIDSKFIPIDGPMVFDGIDSYASQFFSGLDENVVISWMSNWLYAKKVPTYPWRGSYTIPRTVKRDERTNRIIQSPIPELQILRKEKHEERDIEIKGSMTRTFHLPFPSNQIEIMMTNITSLSSYHESTNSFCIELYLHTYYSSSETENLKKTIVRVTSSSISIDRKYSGVIIDPKFGDVYEISKYKEEEEISKIQVFCDWSSIEIFVNDGTIASALVFPEDVSNEFYVLSCADDLRIGQVVVYQVDSIHS